MTFSKCWKTKAALKGDAVVIESKNRENNSSSSWNLFPGGRVELNYEFDPIFEALTYCAVGFDLEKKKVVSKQWTGAGPFRIWANRRKGPRYGLWENEYNNAITGGDFIYPEFKGVFGQINWMRIGLKSNVQLVLQIDARADVGVLRPKNASNRAKWAYPDSGGLFLFHKVPAVGTKFKKAKQLGPQSLPETLSGPLTGHVVFQI